jgi:hypothetical protein
MDPWLEHPAVFPDFHDGFVGYVREALQPRLPEPYFASLGTRVWVEPPGRHPVPDVAVLAGRSDEPDAPGAASAEPTDTGAVIVTVPVEEFREPFVEILAGRDGSERLVTVIEVLSLSNKTPGAQGRDLYLQKQRELLGGAAHLVEIDLLRGGRHSTAVPRARAGTFDYHVCIHRFERPADFVVHPIRLPNRLPVVSVPLLPGDGEVPLDLQAVFDRNYDAGPYRRRVRYSEGGPVPPLTPEQSAWARGVLRERGGAPAPAPSAT